MRERHHLQTYQVRHIIGDHARWLDKLIAYNLYRAKVDKANPGGRLAVHRLARGGVLFPSIAQSKNMYHCVNSIACTIPSHISHNAMRHFYPPFWLLKSVSKSVQINSLSEKKGEKNDTNQNGAPVCVSFSPRADRGWEKHVEDRVLSACVLRLLGSEWDHVKRYA